MTVAEEYQMLIRQQDDRHAVALAENKRLKAEIASLRGITLSQKEVDDIINLLPTNLHDEYRYRKQLEKENY